MARSRKSDEMRKIERERGQSIESLIREMYDQDFSTNEMAKSLGISRQTLYQWMARLGAVTEIRFASEETEQPVG